MKLIIDIEDLLYEHIKTNSFGIYNGRLYEAVRNGVPLADIAPEHQTESLISKYQNDFLNKQLHIPNEEE